jgi:aminomethyltransferase
MAKPTPLHGEHLADGGRMVDFAGWDLPLHFGSQLQEHRSVRRHGGMFDVSHMTVIDIAGARAREFLRQLLTADVDRIEDSGGALYSCLLNEAGGIIDDLIVYRWSPQEYRLVTNAATRTRVVGWLAQHGPRWDIAPVVAGDLAMIAVQGPGARRLAAPALPGGLADAATGLAPFKAVREGRIQVGCTGYTGEDGYEIILPAADAPALWRRLRQDLPACGLAARDSLRLEAGLRLYGVDMDETVTPAEAGLQWTCDLRSEQRAFIGRAVVAEQQLRGAPRELTGVVLRDKGMIRAGQTVTVPGLGTGTITSGGFSPQLDHSIGFARLPAGAARIGHGTVQIRDQSKTVHIGSTRFLRR